jgi:radical SAM protein with 4Fe4S-binding SPASM domain
MIPLHHKSGTGEGAIYVLAFAINGGVNFVCETVVSLISLESNIVRGCDAPQWASIDNVRRFPHAQVIPRHRDSDRLGVRKPEILRAVEQEQCAHRQMLIDPCGKVLPCHAATVIPGLQFENVRSQSLEWIWRESISFQEFRGEDWMLEPCRSCDRRARDFGGCRCQAFMITGDATATDPVCSLAPAHDLIEQQLSLVNSIASPRKPATEQEEFWTYRSQPK